MENRESLERQLADLEARKATLFESEFVDQVAVSRLNEQIAEVRQQLGAIDTKEAIIAEANDPESSFTLTVDGYTVDFRAESASEEAYQALRIVTQLKLQELEQQNQNEIRALKASYETERQQFEMQIENLEAARQALQQSVEEIKQENAQLSDRLYDANLQVSDRDRKLAIAASEIDSLKAQVEELRAQVSKPTVPTNLDNAALSEAMRKLKESKRAIYNVVKDGGNINYTARYVDTNEEFTGLVVYIGKYRVLSDEEAARFRAELEAAEEASEAELESIPENDEPVNEVDFRDITPPDLPDAHTNNGVDRDETVSEGTPNHDGGTAETWEQWVERSIGEMFARMANIDGQLYAIAPPKRDAA